VRFKDFEYDSIPGPGLYKLKGFAEETIEKAMKFSINQNQYISPNKNNIDLDKNKTNEIEIIDNEKKANQNE
jgi:hypothetical protein